MNKWLWGTGESPFKRYFIFCFLIICLALPLQAKGTEKTKSIKIALLPIIDTLPFYVAEAEGYFEKEGISVKAVPVASGIERDQLMQVGEIDGMLNEMMSSAVFNRDESRIKIISIARAANHKSPLFRVLGSPKHQLRTTKDLAGVPIGVSINTIIEYVTERLLMKKNLSRKQINLKSVPSIPERYQLLMQGQLKAATLPDPLAKSALEAGAALITDDTEYPSYSVSVLSFSDSSLQKKTGTIRLFLKAWYRAAQKINTEPERFRSLMLKKIRVPGNVKNTYEIPEFSIRKIPDQKQWSDVMDWMIQKGLLTKRLPYSGSVTNKYFE